MTSKYNVKGNDAHPIYLWAKENFGNSAVPKWNFHKILINKDGKIEDTYGSITNPMSGKIVKKIEEIL
jgi:glutathione peroxidase